MRLFNINIEAETTSRRLELAKELIKLTPISDEEMKEDILSNVEDYGNDEFEITWDNWKDDIQKIWFQSIKPNYNGPLKLLPEESFTIRESQTEESMFSEGFDYDSWELFASAHKFSVNHRTD